MSAMLAASAVTLASCLFATHCARAGVARLQPAYAWGSCRCLTASLAGGGFSLLFTALASKFGPSFCLEPSAAAAVMMICPFLSVAAYTDFESSWAPFELMAPICAMAAAVILSPNHLPKLSAWAASIFVGIALYCAAHLAWRVQCVLKRPAIPPADCIALALPVSLFGMHSTAAGAYAAAALALLAMRIVPAGLKPFPDGTACRWISSGQKFGGMAERVPLLSVLFPILLLGLIASTAFGFPPADACG